MTDLTEQWIKGELSAEWYYIKFDTTDNIYIAFYEKSEHIFNYCGIHIPENEITAVLAPVPSYEEWRAKLEENKKLKELLKIILSKTKICWSMVFQKDIINAELNKALLTKIDEVLKC